MYTPIRRQQSEIQESKTDRSLMAALAVVGLCAGWAVFGPGCAQKPGTQTAATTNAKNEPVFASEPVKEVAVPKFALAESASQRVGGDLGLSATLEGGTWKSGTAVISTPLPEGYPAPTPPGAVDLKMYPVVRRAEVRGKEEISGREGAAGFWPLFNHIQRRQIEMTSPVEMEYSMLDKQAGGVKNGVEGGAGDEVGAGGQSAESPSPWTMSFLYRKVEQGPVGRDENDGRVIVFDTPAMLVASRGFQGNYSDERLMAEMDELVAFMAKDGRFVPMGRPRVLMYNGGPGDNPKRYWGEVQVPVKAK